MKWGHSLIVLLVCACVCSCSNPTPEELASLAAKGYYDHLIRGEYEKYLEGKLPGGLMDDLDYRSQLLDNCRQFMSQQNEARHNIREVRVANAQTDTLMHLTNVFLILCFGDSVNEEIVVPMVERDGRWWMK